jgi:formylglycine-generating enzyme required for sulfatase activity
MKKFLLLSFPFLFAGVAAAALVPPQIRNLVSAQRPGTFYVDITYDLIDPDSSTVYIMVEASSDGGDNWLVPAISLSGDFGFVAPGTGKKIVWNAWNDWPGNYTTNAKVRLIADDTMSAIPPPPTNPPAANLVFIPSGSFNMSGTMVWISKSFWMGKYEVTQAEFQSVMTNNPSYFRGNSLPVDSVSWDEAVQYCQKLTMRERAAGRIGANQSYRLPTDAEWEYACRAGTTTLFSCGNDPNFLGFYVWYNENSGDTTHDVGSKRPNFWGLYDMHGNVREWCSDWFGNLPGGGVTDPQGPSSGSDRVIRGGCWYDNAGTCASAYRRVYDPSSGNYTCGFRVVLAPVQ